MKFKTYFLARLWFSKSILISGNSFCHIVQSSKREDHELVTSGVFSYVRHPSYVGWFLWSLGTQVVLLNPICFVLYTGVTWTFFNERIYAEEYLLLRFFGDAYSDYQSKVPAGIPFIRGFFFDQDKSNWMLWSDLSSTRTCHVYHWYE